MSSEVFGFKGQTFGFTPMSCTVHYVW